MTAGSATINGQGTSSVTVNQSTNRAIINWNGFSVGSGETTQFIQPDSNAVVFNRVIGADPSVIAGSLTANGKIILSNGNGILFSNGSHVDVAGLVATTHDVDDAAFMSGGILRFNKSPSSAANASVVNEGIISIRDAGVAALVAPNVRNAGLISAHLGNVALAAGNGFALDLYGDNLVSFSVGDEISSTLTAPDGTPLKALVENSGTISAAGGQVVLTASAARDVVNQTVNVKGIISAGGASQSGGKIKLFSTDGAGKASGTIAIENGAALTAASDTAKGGSVQVLADKIDMQAATVDVSGKTGGGSIRIGGGKQGGEGLIASSFTNIASGAVLNADATDSGNGGDIVIWSDGATRYKGSLSARGGANGGDGGFAEVSGKGQLAFSGNAYLTATMGAKGTLLLDPQGLIIDTATSDVTCNGTECIGDNGASRISYSDVENLLAVANLTLLTNDGHIIVAHDITWNTDSMLLLSARDDVVIENSATITNTYNGSFAGNRIPVLLAMRADNQGTGAGNIINNGNIDFSNSSGAVSMFYALHGNYTIGNYQTNGGWDGSAGNGSILDQFTAYKLINNVDDLYNTDWRNGEYYALSRTIDGDGQSFNGNNTLGSNFNSILDGQYCALIGGSVCGIVNFNLDAGVSGANQIGLFSSADAGEIRNLAVGLNIYNVSGVVDQVGGLIAHNGGANIKNVTSTGSISGNPVIKAYVGGLVGENDNGVISNSSASGRIDMQTNADIELYVGGLVGLANKNIIDSYASNDIFVEQPYLTNTSYIGGLVGLNNADIEGSYTTGSIYADATAEMLNNQGALMIGGFVGYNNKGAITNSYSAGEVEARNAVLYVGGFAGKNDVTIDTSFSSAIVRAVVNDGKSVIGGMVGINNSQIFHSYSTGAVIVDRTGLASDIYIGGLVGYSTAGSKIDQTYATGYVKAATLSTVGGLIAQDDGTTTNSYWNTETSGQQASASGTGITTAEMQDSHVSMHGFDNGYWGIVDGLSNPYLLNFYSSGTPQVIAGYVRNDFADIGANGGLEVKGLIDGEALSSLEGRVTTGADGYYYFLLPQDTINGAGQQVLTYLSDFSAATLTENVYDSLNAVKAAGDGTLLGNYTMGLFRNNLFFSGGTDMGQSSNFTDILANLSHAMGTHADEFNFSLDNSAQNITLNDGLNLMLEVPTGYGYFNMDGGWDILGGNNALSLAFFGSPVHIGFDGMLTAPQIDATAVNDILNNNNLILTAVKNDIHVYDAISWSTDKRLVISSLRSIHLYDNNITNTYSGSFDENQNPVLLALRTDNGSSSTAGLVDFTGAGKIDFSSSTGAVSTFYRTSVTDPAKILLNGGWSAPNQVVSSQWTDYKLIWNMEELAAIGTDTSAYALATNISAPWNGSYNNTTIEQFFGTLDGQYCALTGGANCGFYDINIESDDNNNIGLYGLINSNAVVRNLVANIDVYSNNLASGEYSAGVIAARNKGNISNVHATGNIVAHEDNQSYDIFAGGLVAQNLGGGYLGYSSAGGNIRINNFSTIYMGGLAGMTDNTNIENSFATGNIAAKEFGAAYLGGLVGVSNNAAIQRSYATGNIYGDGGYQFTGGLVGINAAGSTISESFASGNIYSRTEATSYEGGLVGYNDGAVSNSYAMGNTTFDYTNGGSYFIGGLAGYNTGGATIASSYAVGAVGYIDLNQNGGNVTINDGGAAYGPAVGYNDGGTINDVYYDAETTGRPDNGVGTAKTTAELQTNLGDLNFDTNVWGMVNGISYGYLLWQFENGATPQVVAGTAYSSYKVDSNTVAVAGQSITGYVDGHQMVSALTNGNAQTFANGYYYFLLAPDTIDSHGSKVLTSMHYTTYDASSNPIINQGASYDGNVTGSVNDLTVFNNSLLIKNNASSLSQTIADMRDALGTHADDYFFSLKDSGLYMDPDQIVMWRTSGGSLNIDQLLSTSVDHSAVYFGLDNAFKSGTGRMIAEYVQFEGGDYNFSGAYDDDIGQVSGAADNVYLQVGGHDLAVNSLDVANVLTIDSDASINANFGGNWSKLLLKGSGVLSSATPGQINVGMIAGDAASVSLNNGVHNLQIGSVNGIDGLTTTGNTTLITSGTFTLAQDMTAGGGGTSLVISTGVFDNSAAKSLDPGVGGRFLVWSGTPVNDDRGGLSYNFKQYNATYGVTAVAGTGNGFLYTLAPSVATTLTGTVTKQYDATNTAALTGANYTATTGVVDGDTVVLSNPTTGTYNNANAASGKNVSVAASTISSATNGAATIYGYQVTATAAAAIGEITARVLTLGGSFTANNKQYDSTNAATINNNSLTLIGVQNDEDVTLASQTLVFAGVNKGDGQTVSITGATLGGTANLANYTLSIAGAPTTTANILARVLTIGGSFTANNKSYDATAAATIDNNSLTLIGVQNGEDVTLASQIVAFANATAGNGKTVSITGATLGGTANLGNYSLSLAGAPTTTANIVAAILQVTISGSFTAANKVYDGTTTATILNNSLSLSGAQGGDDVSLVAVANFDSAAKGTGKTVSLLSSYLSGMDMGNYTLDFTGAPTALANITDAVTVTSDTPAVQAVIHQMVAPVVMPIVPPVDNSKLSIATNSQESPKMGFVADGGDCSQEIISTSIGDKNAISIVCQKN